MSILEEASDRARLLNRDWQVARRWEGVRRDYSAEDVVKLQGSIKVDYTLARLGAERLWDLLHEDNEGDGHVAALGATTANQAVQMVKAGLKAIYLSGWQVAGDNNLAEEIYPDQSLYPVNSAPSLVRRINNGLRRADQIDCVEGRNGTHWMAPVVADAEAGFGGPLNTFELMKKMIESGAAGVHLEDQLSSEKKCGHMGGKVLVPTAQNIRNLAAARLAADVCEVSTILIARTDSLDATLLTSDVDPRDRPFLTGERTAEGLYVVRSGMAAAVYRSLAYAPYVDMLWMETSSPDLEEARVFAESIHAQFPGKLLAYNCSPSFNWRKHLDSDTIGRFQRELAAMGYRFQFITLAGFHAINATMFELAREYAESGMAAYTALQEKEFAMAASGYTATRHQREVGAGYFDAVAQAIAGGRISTLSMQGSTEEAQFSSDSRAAGSSNGAVTLSE